MMYDSYFVHYGQLEPTRVFVKLRLVTHKTCSGNIERRFRVISHDQTHRHLED